MINKRFYTTDVKDSTLPPNWVTGFVDAEGSFSLKISKSSSTRSGYNIVPEFKIELHNRDILLLRKRVAREPSNLGVDFTGKKILFAHETQRFYTTVIKGINANEPELDPNWVTGFADAEACFALNVHKKSTFKIGWGVQPEFNISLHLKDLILLRQLHLFFGVGTVHSDEAKNMAYYRVASLRDIANIIIPHFNQYPLITQKKADFLLFKQGVNLLNLKAHREIEGLRQILSLSKASMNWPGQSQKLISNFPGILPHPRPIVNLDVMPDPDWFTGFVDREGCFYLSTTKSKSTKTGVSLALVFSISQPARDELLLTKFIEFLGCGIVYKFSTRPSPSAQMQMGRPNSISFTVSKFKHITEKVIPFFQKYPLQGIKALDFQCFCEIAKIIESKGHLTDEGFKKIRSLKSGMNANRKMNQVLLPRFLDDRGNRLTLDIANTPRNYCTLPHARCSEDNFKLDPNWVTGFTDGEGCFHISITEDKRQKLGWQVRPCFQIALHRKDKALLEAIQKYFGVGKISRQGPQALQLEMQSLNEIEIVIKHFNKYQLITSKLADFKAFRLTYLIFKNKEHLTPEGLRKIVAIRASMNRGLSDKLKLAFPGVVPVERSLVELPKTIDPQWLAGFTSAEGCFLIIVGISPTKLGLRVKLVFQLTQHSRDSELMKSLIQNLESGYTSQAKTRPHELNYLVTKFSDISNKIIPFFQKHPVYGVKALDFADFSRAAELMKEKKHLTLEGLKEISKIKAGMNTGRKI